MNIDANGVLRWNTPLNVFGVYGFTIITDNEFGQPATRTFTWNFHRNPRVFPFR